MELTRRNFLAGAGAALAGSMALGARTAWADEEPAEDGAEGSGEGAPGEGLPFTCAGCAAGCTGLAAFEGDGPAAVSGDGANPLSGGRLCLRGQQWPGLREERDAATGGAVPNPRRLGAPRVRRAGSDVWEDISWDMALSEIASLVKKTRDDSFVAEIDEAPVMRTEAIASFGGAQLLAEEQFLLAKALRSWGVVHLDNEAAAGRRAFACGVEATCGFAEPDGLPSDLANSQAVLMLGADVAASAPVSLRWIEQARARGARWIVADPLRTRSAEMADAHLALRPGTDVAFLGGLVKYILDNSLWQPEYVLNFTGASLLLDRAFAFDGSTGVFSGWDPMTGAYDKASWAWQTDGEETWNMRYEGEFAWVRGEGVPVWSIPAAPKPVRDITLQDPLSSWAQMQALYSRYDMDTVSAVCGVDREALEAAYGAFAATGAPGAAGKIVAGAGLVQHGGGAQAARAACLVQLLLGNMGVPGGGIDYASGAPGEAAADMLGLRPDRMPGGLPWPAESDGSLQAWLDARVEPAGAGAQNPKVIVSALKEWWGPEGSFENDYGYDWLPKRGAEGASDLFGAIADGTARGCFTWETDLIACAPGGFGPQHLAGLEWLVAVEAAPSTTASFWRAPGVDPAAVATTVYELPAALGPEKTGMRAAGPRLLLHEAAAAEPFGDSRPALTVIDELWRRVRNLYDTKGGESAEPVLKASWAYLDGDALDPVRVAWALNGYRVEDSDVAAGRVLFLEDGSGLAADGSTACAAAPLAGCWNDNVAPAEAAGQPVGRRDATDVSGLGLFPSWGFTWPGNVRVRGNRASANLAGQPWVAERALLSWDGQTWAFVDQADFPALREGRWVEPDNRAFPGLWEGVGLLVSDRLDDGPLPEYYEPLESPLNNRLNSSYASPALMTAALRGAFAYGPSASAADAQGDGQEAAGADGGAGAVDAAVQEALAPDYSAIQADREAHPIAAVVNGARPETAALRTLGDAMRALTPGCFVEVSPELARIRGIATGDTVRVFNDRGSMTAPALVTARLAPFACEGIEAHYVCLNGLGAVPGLGDEGQGDAAPAEGDAASAGCRWQALAPAVANPMGASRDGKGFLVDIEKA